MFRFLIASFAIAVTVMTVLQTQTGVLATLPETDPLSLATSKSDHFVENKASVVQMEALINTPTSEISDKIVSSFSDFDTWSSVVPVDTLTPTQSMMDEISAPQDISLTNLNQSDLLTTDKES